MNRAERFYATSGFSLVDTGGGCNAFEKVVRDGRILITARGDTYAPISEQEEVLVGLYRGDESEPSGIITGDGETVIRKIAANEWEVQ